MSRLATSSNENSHTRRAATAVALATLAIGCSAAPSDPPPRTYGPGASTGVGGGSAGIDTEPRGLGSGCASDVYRPELLPLDLFVMLDRSGSMLDLNKWNAVSGAITDFMSLPDLADFGMGIQFFPQAPSAPPPLACATEADCGAYGPCFFGTCMSALGGGDSCSAGDYATPAVPIAPLPEAAASISNAIDVQAPSGSTPMAPALEGAIDYAQQWAASHPAHAVAVVLATDGEPTACNPGTVQTVAARAAEGFAQNPSVKTFVIGIGQSLTSLNEIAKQGGTDQALIISDANAGDEFFDALNHIRGGLSCTMSIPLPPSGQPNPSLVNVAFTPDGATQEVLPRVGSSFECGSDAGWYYDNPTAPQRIVLCPSSCSGIDEVQGTMEVVLGCDSVVK